MSRGLHPIDARVRVYEEVAARLRDWADMQGLKPGDRLPAERELAQILAVSRTSVRQGLTALRTMGLIDVRHGDGVYLRRSPADVKPELARDLLAAQRSMPLIMETREALETQIVRLAAMRRNDDDLRAMRKALDDMKTAIDAGKPPDTADQRFHAALAAAAQNALLEDLMRQLTEPIKLTRRASFAQPGRGAQSLAEHENILDAIRTRDADAASAAMRVHLTTIASLTQHQTEGTG